LRNLGSWLGSSPVTQHRIERRGRWRISGDSRPTRAMWIGLDWRRHSGSLGLDIFMGKHSPAAFLCSLGSQGRFGGGSCREGCRSLFYSFHSLAVSRGAGISINQAEPAYCSGIPAARRFGLCDAAVGAETAAISRSWPVAASSRSQMSETRLDPLLGSPVAQDPGARVRRTAVGLAGTLSYDQGS
jgi:hypothetical protein